MVVLVDLAEDSTSNSSHHFPHLSEPLPLRDAASKSANTANDADDKRPNPNVNSFSAALSCYPIVSQLASLIDLNTLHDLSRTCRQFRVNLLEFRSQLITQTLRCSNEDKPVNETLADRFRESHSAWSGQSLASYSGRITSGKIGQCARDMVGECRRCGVVVCRNCTTKPPPTSALAGRHRRLCTPCTKVPLSYHLSPPPPIPTSPLSTPSYSQRSTPSPEPFLALTPTSSRGSSPPSPQPQPAPTSTPTSTPAAFTSSAFTRTPCTCPTALYLCQPCGLSLRRADSEYYRGWTWRTHYSTYLGGLGTGIGEGNEGVPCGRASACLSARTFEKELDVSDAEMAMLLSASEQVEQDGSGRSWRGGSWVVQECEGVGGGMRMKTKKRERVGGAVREFEDERDGGKKALERETKGERRSWCAWCQRVVPGQKDLVLSS